MTLTMATYCEAQQKTVETGIRHDVCDFCGRVAVRAAGKPVMLPDADGIPTEVLWSCKSCAEAQD